MFVDIYKLVNIHQKILDLKNIEKNRRAFQKEFQNLENKKGRFKRHFKRNKLKSSEFAAFGITAVVGAVVSGGVIPVVAFVGKVIGMPALRKCWRHFKHYKHAKNVMEKGKRNAKIGKDQKIYDYKLLAKELFKIMRGDESESSFKDLRHEFNHIHHGNITTFVDLTIVLRTYYDQLKKEYRRVCERKNKAVPLQCKDYIGLLQYLFGYLKTYQKIIEIAAIFKAIFSYVEYEIDYFENHFEKMVRKPEYGGGGNTLLSKTINKRLSQFFDKWEGVYSEKRWPRENEEDFVNPFPEDGSMDYGKFKEDEVIRKLPISSQLKYFQAYAVHQYAYHTVQAQIFVRTNRHNETVQDQNRTYFDCIREKLKVDENNYFWNLIDNEYRAILGLDRSGDAGQRKDFESHKKSEPSKESKRFKDTAKSELQLGGGIYTAKAVGKGALKRNMKEGLFVNTKSEFMGGVKDQINPMSSLWSGARQAVNVVDIVLTITFCVLTAFNAKRNLKKLKKSNADDLYMTTLGKDKEFKRLQILRMNLKKKLLEGWQEAFVDYKARHWKLYNRVENNDDISRYVGVFNLRQQSLLKLLWYHRYMKEFHEEVLEKIDRMTVRTIIMGNEIIDGLDVFFDKNSKIALGNKHKFVKGESALEACDSLLCYSESNLNTNYIKDQSKVDWNRNPSQSKVGSKKEFSRWSEAQKEVESILREWESCEYFTEESAKKIRKQFKKKDRWKEKQNILDERRRTAQGNTNDVFESVELEVEETPSIPRYENFDWDTFWEN